MRLHIRTLALTWFGFVIACCVGPSLAGQVRTEQGRPDQYTGADIAYGARIYDAQCTTCHGSNGDGVGGVDLRSGRFRNATSDQDLARVITTGITGTGMLAFTLDPSELTGVIAFLRNMNTFDPGTIAPGDEARGRAVVEGKGDCLRCHRVGTRGSRVAPDLTDIGSVRGPGSLQRSLLDPTSQMMPINRPIKAVTRDGKVINGRRLNEDTYTLQLVDEQERLLSLDKSQLREFTIQTTSPMPSYKDKLSENEIADTVAYLLSLKGRQ
jgi:putative heme-binding domain-containing protein